MSIQNINPYLFQQQYNQFIPFQAPIVQSQYMANPYQASFYNQSLIYPYNQIFTPIASKDYVKTGQTVSPTGEMTHFYKLKNGHEIAIMQRKDESTIVKTFVDAGSMNETDEKRGVQHVNEHGLFKGSTHLKDGDVFKLTGQMGASTNASTDYAQINYYITAPYMGEEELKKTIAIQGDMVYNPTFDYEAMESEKEPICSEISMINDDPTTRAFDKVIRNLFQINSTSENMVAGSIATVKALSTDDMHNYHQTYYRPENLHTVIIADESIPIDNILKYAVDSFKPAYEHNQRIEERKEILRPLQVSKREDVISSKTNSTNVFVAFSGPKPTDSKDFIIEKMLSYFLSSCSTSDLKKKLEDENAYYSSTIQKVGLHANDPYALVSLMETNPNGEQVALDAFYDAITKLQTTLLSDDDMLAIKNNIKFNTEFNLCDSESLCDTLGNSMRDNSIDYFANYKDMIENVTKEDIMNFARKYYNLNKASIVVVHPSSVSASDIQTNYSNSKYSAPRMQNQQNVSFTGIKNVNTDDIKEYELSNNTHLVLNKTNSNLSVFDWKVSTPPIKPKNPNIPLVLRYMFTKGSEYKNQSELERYEELNGIESNVLINEKGIEIATSCLGESTEKALSLMNELLYHPKLTEKDFESAKRYVKSLVEASSKDASSNLLDRLYPGYFPTNRQLLATIDDLRLNDVKAYYNELLQNASSTFVATIPSKDYDKKSAEVIRHQNMPNVIFKKSVPKLESLFVENKEANVIYDTDDLNQAQILKTYKFPMSGNIEDEVKFELLHTILGGSSNSRMFSDLREKQNLAYSVSSSIQSFENTGILSLQIQTTTDNKEAGIQSFDNVEKSLEGFNKHTELLKNELVTDEELAAAKMRLKQKITGECQHPANETDLLAMTALEPYGIKRIDRYVDAIDKITKEDIRKAANFIFSYKPTISILASPETINSQLPYLETQGKLEQA